jgi:ethanolamine utilization protein EutQ (cupin superfamily)
MPPLLIHLVNPPLTMISRYSYDEMKIVLEGHFYIKDETGKEVKAEKGDVFLFPKGSRIIFRTDDYGLAFFVGQRKKDTL